VRRITVAFLCSVLLEAHRALHLLECYLKYFIILLLFVITYKCIKNIMMCRDYTYLHILSVAVAIIIRYIQRVGMQRYIYQLIHRDIWIFPWLIESTRVYVRTIIIITRNRNNIIPIRTSYMTESVYQLQEVPTFTSSYLIIRLFTTYTLYYIIY